MESSRRNKLMVPTWIKTVLAVKSMIEFTLACQVAAAGQIVVGMCVAVVGIAPHAWSLSRRVVEGPRE
jgi:hypothetical protein